MSLRSLGQVSCKLFGHGACECSPTALSAIRFCRPITTVAKPGQERRRQPFQSTIPQLSPKTAMNLPQVRYASTKSDSDNNSSKDKTSKLKASTSEQATTVAGKLQKMWKAYGVLAVGTYLGVYVSTLGSVFLALDYDVFNAATVGLDPVYAIHMFCDVVEKVTGNTNVPAYIRENPRVGTFAIAWVMTKFTEPLRLGVTIATVPTIARWLGRRREKADDDDDDDDDKKDSGSKGGKSGEIVESKKN